MDKISWIEYKYKEPKWFITDQLSRLSDNDASGIESQFLMMIKSARFISE